MARLIQTLGLLITLIILWLVLAGDFSLAQTSLGLLGAIWVAWMIAQMRPIPMHLKRFTPLLLLCWRVFVDMLVSNLTVVKQIYFYPKRCLRSGIVQIPLDLKDPHAIAVLACIITYTPGTVWADFTDEGILHLHVLDLDDQEIWIKTIKNRYESLLLKLF